MKHMKKIHILVLMVVSLVLLSACDWLNTPLAPPVNTTPQGNPLLNPTFSHQGGFYDTAIELAIFAKPNTTLYVTFDGSIPTQESMIYHAPILLEESYIVADGSEILILPDTVYEGPISMIRTTSSRWHSPKDDLFKAHTIRVLAVDLFGHASQIITQTYFVHPNIFSLYTFPIMSLSTDRQNLFDFETGINVPGVHFDTGIENERDNRTGNYFMRGDEWERPVFVEYFDLSGQRQMALDAGIRIHGGLSRKYAIKSYRLYARDSYGSISSFNYPFFDELEDDSFKRLILRGFGQAFEYTLFGEAAAHQVLQPLTLDIQQSSPIILFINGEYFGIRNIRERLDHHYLNRHYGLDPNDVTLLVGQGYLDYGQAIGSAQYMAMYHFITTKDMKNQALYRQASEQMDMDNFIDYNIAQLYFANMDWPQNNVLYWKKNVRYSPNAPYGHDGRWRWMIFDLDAGFGASWGGNRPELNSFERLTGDSWKTGQLFISLLENPEFKAKFIYRLLALSNTVFHPNRTTQIIRDMKLEYLPEIEDHIARWGFPSSYNTWDHYVTRMLTFATMRNEYFIEHMEAFFALSDQVMMRFESNPSHGTLVINGQKIASKEDLDLYSTLPIWIEAAPQKGYHLHHFINQDGTILSNQSAFLLEPNEGMHVIAIYALGDPKPNWLEATWVQETGLILTGVLILACSFWIQKYQSARKIKKHM